MTGEALHTGPISARSHDSLDAAPDGLVLRALEEWDAEPSVDFLPAQARPCDPSSEAVPASPAAVFVQPVSARHAHSRRLARRLSLVAAILGLAASSLGFASAARPGHGAPGIVPAVRVAMTSAPRASAAAVVSVARSTVVVRPGDSLWTISARALGDGQRWPEIWRLNRHHVVGSDAARLTNPRVIRPGWRLVLP